jgi:hypothetical protein
VAKLHLLDRGTEHRGIKPDGPIQILHRNSALINPMGHGFISLDSNIHRTRRLSFRPRIIPSSLLPEMFSLW